MTLRPAPSTPRRLHSIRQERRRAAIEIRAKKGAASANEHVAEFRRIEQ